MRRVSSIFLFISIIALVAMAIWAPNSEAYQTYSANKDPNGIPTGNCVTCHEVFDAPNYISRNDGTPWGTDLHVGHRSGMLNRDCDTCHTGNFTTRYPVSLNASNGGTGFDPISCVGCHGRDGDLNNGQIGAGLRQHHTNANAAFCGGCHQDNLPGTFTPVGEDDPPSYYFTPDAAHPDKPTDPCNANAGSIGQESVFGTTGLDNDGDLSYDGADPNCGAAEPDINLNPAALDFGVVTIGSSSTLTAQIENLGTADLTVTSITLAAGTSAEFTFTDPTPIVIPPGGTQAVTVTYTPVDVGLDTGGLDIASDDPDEPTVTLALSGTGEAAPTPDINLNPAALDFGTVFTGNASTLNANIENLGTAELTVTLIDLCVGTSTEFSFTADPTLIVIPPGGNRMVSVTYTPVDVGADAGCLDISSDDPDEPVVQLDLQGTGAEELIPDINLNPAALDFGVVTIGNSSTLSADIENLGNADLTVTSITLAAGTSAEFTFTDPTPIVIPPGGTQAVMVTYTPVDVGLDTGGLDIASDDPDEPTVTLALSGTGEAAPTPDINLNPAALDFGVVTIGNSSTLSADIENLGNADLTVDSIALCVGTSTEFIFMADPTPIIIPPGGSRMVSVTYTPVDVGMDTGCLEISSDDPDEPLVELGLTGEGVDQAVIEAEVEAPGAVNGRSGGRTPIGIDFDENGMLVEIVELVCYGNVSNVEAMPERINADDEEVNQFTALFRTRDLELVCADTEIVCEGTLADGRSFEGMDEIRVVRDVDGERCK